MPLGHPYMKELFKEFGSQFKDKGKCWKIHVKHQEQNVPNLSHCAIVKRHFRTSLGVVFAKQPQWLVALTILGK